jgi:hypothetical protein
MPQVVLANVLLVKDDEKTLLVIKLMFLTANGCYEFRIAVNYGCAESFSYKKSHMTLALKEVS